MGNHHFNGKINYKLPFSIAMLNYQRVYSWVLRHALSTGSSLRSPLWLAGRSPWHRFGPRPVLSLTCLWRWVYHAMPCYTLVYTHTYYLGWCLSWTSVVNGMVLHWVYQKNSTPQISKNRCRVSRPLRFPDFTGVWCQPRIKKPGWFGGPHPKNQSLPLRTTSPANHGLVANLNIFGLV